MASPRSEPAFSPGGVSARLFWLCLWEGRVCVALAWDSQT